MSRAVSCCSGIDEFWREDSNLFRTKSAYFSEDRRYRYLLRRRVGDSSRRVLFVMLNPSAADEVRDDPTIRRCIGFARKWGYGLLDVVNLFALMSTDPKGLLEVDDPVGPYNDAMIHHALEAADSVVLAWGNHGLDHPGRVKEVTAMVRRSAQPLCLGLTLKGAPRHPLRLARTTALCRF
ncbi:MAG: DUF1643 domain-containing protein [Dehalococcoidia bacterium]|nr:DUF1643 domain-containing protein [Dehalococcoidia bacterium]